MWSRHPVEGYYNRQWLTGLWSTQAKVERIMLKAAWHWGSKSSVINDPIGEPGHTPLHVGIPSVWGSVHNDHMFSPCFIRQLLNKGLLRDMNE